MANRSVTIGGTSYPVVLPSIRDPRLHVAAVIITIHVLGQVFLRFQVSVPQILAAILTCWILEIAITFRQAKAFVWPASAMLTGSGVALILRVVGTPVDDHWTFHAWYVYAVVAGLSLLSKYVIRYRGSHVFNPSNIGLVLAFVSLGTGRVEPLDFWWAPLDLPMAAAYAVILGGGLLITRRLHLLGLAAAFWLTLATGLGLLAASGHCMTASWAFAPVCGVEYWRVIVTSPEVMIFLFFMITDPKTVPGGSVGRVVFGVLVGISSILLMAPQVDEFGTKVGLLSGLVLVCAVRPVLDRVLPEPRSAADDLRRFAARLATGGEPAAGLARAGARLAVGALAVLVLGVGIVAAGTPARGFVAANPADILGGAVTPIDPGTLPPLVVRQDVVDFDHELAGPEMQGVVVTLAQNLELENQALLRRDRSLLTAVDHGDRLQEMEARLQAASSTGQTLIRHYRFASIDVAMLRPFGRQTGLSLGLSSRGTVVIETYDGAGTLQSSRSEPFDVTFAMRRATGARWMNVAVIERPAAP
jgi:Na+-translocating ferredoxin:NAD+ oxidoreductase RnfD subunit